MKHKSEGLHQCSEIQIKLVDIPDPESFVSDNKEIQSHLENCEECSHYYNSIISLTSHLQINRELKPFPDPKIRKNIVQYLEIRNQIRSEDNGRFIDWLRSLLTIRIPVYQAVSGLAVIIILFMFLAGARKSSGLWWMEIDYSKKSEAFENNNLYVLDTLHLLDTSNGQNAMEDSILVGFLESSL